MQIEKVAEARLPTSWGEFLMVGFKELVSGKEHLALIHGNLEKDKSVLTRIHSECLTGDALFSIRCDCGPQLRASLEIISKENCGILIYHRQEGRNIGLINKIRAYALQDIGYDTVEANKNLGFSPDERDFSPCVEILKLLSIQKVRLLTNNPGKIECLQSSGIKVTERLPLIAGHNPKNAKYLKTKAEKMGHFLDRPLS